MDSILKLIDQGGMVMIALICLSVLLYERCFNLWFFLFQFRQRLSNDRPGKPEMLAELRSMQRSIEEYYSQHRLAIGALIASAPLLGLLGTVVGMVEIFQSLASKFGQKSVEGLADGISKALITTETGLAVAIPAVIITYYSHRQLQRGIRKIVELEEVFLEER